MGSYLFFAPEMFLKTKESKVRGEMTDLWALGVTIFYLLTGRYPSGQPKNVMDLKEIVTHGVINFNLIKCKPARDLLTKMLALKPEDRLSLT